MPSAEPAGPVPLDEATRLRMRRQRQTGTKPELALRRELHRRGLRYRLSSPIKGVRPDLIFPGIRLAVFVDGCFWHGCPAHGTHPKNNADWWTAKLEANKKRDARQTAALTKKCVSRSNQAAAM
jgi:DNA mismatch endonuclease (patch repair protein)